MSSPNFEPTVNRSAPSTEASVAASPSSRNVLGAAPPRARRPTRAATRDRLLDAAMIVFGRHGIGAASIEAITDEAGFSRGAFYSNFADKDALVLAVLERSSALANRTIEGLLATTPDPDDFLRETQSYLASPSRSSVQHDPTLAAELMLYALRSATARPLLKSRFDRSRTVTLAAVEQIAAARGLGPAPNRRTIAEMIGAVEIGFDFFALVDPTFDANAAFATVIEFLSEAGAAIARVEQLDRPRSADTLPAE